MSRQMADDYFSLTMRPHRDGALSPYTASILTPTANSGLHPTLSWGETPDFEGLRKTKSHTGETIFKSMGVASVQADTKVYPYHKIHLKHPVPENLKPLTPDDVLARVTGKCINCSAANSAKCSHISQDSIPYDQYSNSLASPVRKREIPLKSILARRGDERARIDSHFSNSVSFDTVNLRFSDDANNYPMYTFSDSDNDADDDGEDDNDDDYNLTTKNNTRKNSSPNGNSNNNNGGDNASDGTDYEVTRGRPKANSGNILPRRTSSRSPSRSLSPSSRIPITSNIDMVSQKESTMKSLFSLKYPTSPIITHDACTLTRKHKLFDDMYAGRLKYVTPKLHNRDIMCYISGRKHTWVGIDWACNQFLEDGDSLVIVSSIKNPGRSLSRFQRRNSDLAIPNITENKIRNSPEYTQAVTENIMKYVLSILNPDKIVKITVELAIGSTNDVFQDIFDLYQPSLVIIGAKPGRAAPTKSWATKRLSDRIVVKSPVPTIIVSPINMGLYETKLFKVLDKRMNFLARDYPNKFQENDQLLQELDNVGFYNLNDQREYIRKTAVNDTFILQELDSAIKELEESRKAKSGIADYASKDNNDLDGDLATVKKSLSYEDASIASSSNGSNSAIVDDDDEQDDDSEDDDEDDEDDEDNNGADDVSVDSTNPPAFLVNTRNTPSFKLKRLELEAQVAIYKEVSKLESDPLTEDSFKHLLTVVSDAAHKYGVQLAESAKLGGEESELVRTLTGAPEQVGRRKSMVSESIEKDNFDEKLKKFRQQKKLEQREKLNKTSKTSPKVPKINIDTPSTSFSALKAMKSPGSIKSNGSSSSLQNNNELSVKKESKKKKKGGFFGLFKK